LKVARAVEVSPETGAERGLRIQRGGRLRRARVRRVPAHHR